MRHIDCDVRLVQFIQKNRGRDFEWGQNDCGMFALRCIYAITDRKQDDPLLGKYSNMQEAEIILHAQGWDNLAQAAESIIGVKPIGLPLMAQRGDVVWVADPHTTPEMDLGIGSLLVCTGSNILGPGLHGMVSIPIDKIHQHGALVYRVI